MNITDIKFHKIFTDGNLKAIVSITLDNCLAIHEIKIVQGYDRLFAAMPSRKDSNNIYRDVIHHISMEMRQELEEIILGAYKDHVALLAQSQG